MAILLNEQEIWLKANNLTQNDYQIIDIIETTRLRNLWRNSFIPNISNKSILHKCRFCDNGDKRSYDWHAFSYNEVAAKEVDSDFLKNRLSNYNNNYLLWEECFSYGLIINSQVLRKCLWTNTDIYIFDNTLAWTFVVTHEEWYYYKEI